MPSEATVPVAWAEPCPVAVDSQEGNPTVPSKENVETSCPFTRVTVSPHPVLRSKPASRGPPLSNSTASVPVRSGLELSVHPWARTQDPRVGIHADGEAAFALGEGELGVPQLYAGKADPADSGGADEVG
ncbi:MAG: hypothetical protein M5U19_07390 [Microthrixaceae bacterium]|nr:hypothetical protein [Microthrixaceae bacterium]